MRPRLLHLGYAAGARHPEALAYASMRPRLLHLGYAVMAQTLRVPVDEASMRPRLLHLGYFLVAQGIAFALPGLQ